MVNEMPKYDLTVQQIMEIIRYLEILRSEMIVTSVIVASDGTVEHIDSLIDALKRIKL